MTNAPSIGWIGGHYRDIVTRQSYAPQPQIEGVQLQELQVFGDEGGDFCEVTRFLAGGEPALLPDFHPAQLSYSVLDPGTIKAWHLHGQQDDLWFVPPSGRLLVGLLDVREGSTTYQLCMRLALGGGKARLVYIPRGVAHGVANLGSAAACLLYFVNRAFDPEDPDEHRLPHDLLGAEFWTNRPA